MEFASADAAERNSKTSTGSHQKLLKQTAEKGTPKREGVVTRQRDKLLINNGGTVLGQIPPAPMAGNQLTPNGDHTLHGKIEEDLNFLKQAISSRVSRKKARER